MVSGLHFPRAFMLGGQEKDYVITEPYESSLAVELSEDCEVYLESTGEYPVPLIWSYALGEGTVVVDNLGYLEKGYRGFYSASYSLLGEVCAIRSSMDPHFILMIFPRRCPAETVSIFGGIMT